MEEVDEVELVVQRVTALDLGKAALEACMRVPHPSKPGRRMQEIRGYATTTAALLEMAIWLRQWGIERVVMESTSDYWKGVYYLVWFGHHRIRYPRAHRLAGGRLLRWLIRRPRLRQAGALREQEVDERLRGRLRLVVGQARALICLDEHIVGAGDIWNQKVDTRHRDADRVGRRHRHRAQLRVDLGGDVVNGAALVQVRSPTNPEAHTFR
jgi:hypothetical protein